MISPKIRVATIFVICFHACGCSNIPLLWQWDCWFCLYPTVRSSSFQGFCLNPMFHGLSLLCFPTLVLTWKTAKIYGEVQTFNKNYVILPKCNLFIATSKFLSKVVFDFFLNWVIRLQIFFLKSHTCQDVERLYLIGTHRVLSICMEEQNSFKHFKASLLLM